jgi:hypothetical protein
VIALSFWRENQKHVILRKKLLETGEVIFVLLDVRVYISMKNKGAILSAWYTQH